MVTNADPEIPPWIHGTNGILSTTWKLPIKKIKKNKHKKIKNEKYKKNKHKKKNEK